MSIVFGNTEKVLALYNAEFQDRVESMNKVLKGEIVKAAVEIQKLAMLKAHKSFEEINHEDISEQFFGGEDIIEEFKVARGKGVKTVV